MAIRWTMVGSLRGILTGGLNDPGTMGLSTSPVPTIQVQFVISRETNQLRGLSLPWATRLAMEGATSAASVGSAPQPFHILPRLGLSAQLWGLAPRGLPGMREADDCRTLKQPQ